MEVEAIVSWLSLSGQWCREVVAREFVAFWKRDVPELLQMLSRTLAQAKLPTSFDEARQFSMSHWLDAAPVVSGIAVIMIWMIFGLFGDSPRPATPTTRIVARPLSRRPSIGNNSKTKTAQNGNVQKKRLSAALVALSENERKARVKATGRIGAIVEDHAGEDAQLAYKLCFDDGELPGSDWFSKNCVDLLPVAKAVAPALPKVLPRKDSKAGQFLFEMARGMEESTPKGWVKASGRVGKILREDAVDDELTFKLEFDDGALPRVDWFARDAVEVLDEDNELGEETSPPQATQHDFAKLHAPNVEDVEFDMRESYWVSRDLLLRGMGLCYFCGFAVSAFQHRALWGSLGLQPLGYQGGGRPTPVFELFAQYGFPFDDWLLELVSWIGVCLSFQMMFGRVRSMLIPALLWVSYLSIVNLKAPFVFSYGWEWLTCEVGFLMIFLCPVFSRGLASWTPPPKAVLWLIRWCAFRLLLGAGLSKVGHNSSHCWRDLSCTTTHYYTQPIPNAISWYFHHLPLEFHQVEVALTFVEQLVLPFLMLVPLRPVRLFAAILEVGFQFAIVATGNYAWINFIGALPCISMLDDAFFMWFLPRSCARSIQQATDTADSAKKPLGKRLVMRTYGLTRFLIHVALVAVIVRKSVDPIKEMFGPAPWIKSYDDWFLMNSQGVFGFINQHRVQIVLKYTHDDPVSQFAMWKHLDFKRLPGDPNRFPQFLSPYHSRLDWETWIHVTARMEHLLQNNANAESYHANAPAFLHNLVVKILSGDDDAAGLMGTPHHELYLHGKPPTAISIDYASYTFTGYDEKKAWWRIEPVEPGAAPYVYGQDNMLPKSLVRRSPRERHWILGCCIVCFVAAFEVIMMGCGFVSTIFLLASSICQVHVFGLVLLSDYQDLWIATLDRLPLVELLDALGMLSAGQNSATQICYGYTHLWASVGCCIGTLCLAKKLRKHRGIRIWELLSCVALVAMAFLSRAASLHV
eukprot:TRINITY_DN15833_c0_g1_i1.p1 TRINITY_DN15833_c0_g1~~TRINITY_DN15833_c0_g1_i1.p1  ORF type:complete len:976 (+),score=117.34 TRINITY_DN15833_c0_g1_i1:51-2978(+)